jgi:hypothetical protein
MSLSNSFRHFNSTTHAFPRLLRSLQNADFGCGDFGSSSLPVKNGDIRHAELARPRRDRQAWATHDA